MSLEGSPSDTLLGQNVFLRKNRNSLEEEAASHLTGRTRLKWVIYRDIVPAIVCTIVCTSVYFYIPSLI